MSGKNLRVNLIANTSQFKSAMQQTSNQIKLLNSEFRNAAAETDKYGNKLDSTGAKKKQLNGVIEQYKIRIKEIKNEQKHWTNELKKGNITEEQHAKKQQELATRLNNTEAEMKRYEGQLKRLNAEGKNARTTFDEFDKKFRDVGRTMRNVGTQVGITAGIGFMAMKRVLSDVVEEASSFYAQMSEVQAISSATADEIKHLTNQSKQLGRETMFTAQQAAEAQANLARAGFEVNEIYDAMPGMLDLAASSKLDLGTAANITSNIIRTFNFEAKEAGRVADVLAKGAATANTDVQGLGQAMEVAGPVAHSLGIQLESVAAATGIMADAGIDGSKSGRMLRQGMLRLSKPTGEAAKLIKRMGIEVFDANGNMKSLDKVVAELSKGLKGQTKQQKAAALATIFGSESTAGWTVLLDKGAKELASYTRELENSEGAAKEMAETMQDNAQGAIIRMQSALSGLKIELGEKLLPVIGKAADFIADLANRLSDLDQETITTIAHTGLLVTAVLGVTTAVAGLVTGFGALMAFAGPIGVAIVAGTALLGGLAAAIYRNELKTKSLAEEQERAAQEARRYGEGLREGTVEGVRGYIDLYEGAKLNMHKLKTMSGEEAEQTKQKVVSAFREMGDQVIAELEKFAGEFSEVVNEIYGVYEEEGQKRAKELNEQVQKDVSEMVTNYEKASERIAEIVHEFGGNVEKYPPEIRKTYEANLKIMRDGAQVFATTYEDALAIRNQIAENKDKILAEEAEKWAGEIERVHREGVESINEQYVKQREVIEQFKVLYPEHADVYEEMMQTLTSSTAAEYYKINQAREEATRVLYENVDKTGKLIDLQTGKEFERQKISEMTTGDYISVLHTRAESDEEYYLRYVKTSEEYLDALAGVNEKSLEKIEQNAYEWRIAMGDSEQEAKKFAKNIRKGVIDELEKDDDKAKKAGEEKGKKHKEGLESTKKSNERAGKNITDTTDKELNKNKNGAGKAGKDKGTAHKQGLDSTRSTNISAAGLIASGVSGRLGKTTDGGGGRRAGSLFSSGLRSRSGAAAGAGTSVAKSGERGLRSVKTTSAGNAFVSGFRIAINSGKGSIWNTAWNLGKSALSALKRSIDSRSPSRLTKQEGFNFAEGFAIAIDDNTKKAIQKSRDLGKRTLDALSGEIESYKHSFAKVALGIEGNKQVLKVEHEINNSSLESRIDSLDRTLNRLIDFAAQMTKIQQQQVLAMNEQPIILQGDARELARFVKKPLNEMNALEQKVKKEFGGMRG